MAVMELIVVFQTCWQSQFHSPNSTCETCFDLPHPYSNPNKSQKQKGEGPLALLFIRLWKQYEFNTALFTLAVALTTDHKMFYPKRSTWQDS